MVSRPSEADTLFGANSDLAKLVKFVLGQGVGQVYAIASVKSATAPTLAQRQQAWQTLEAEQAIRIRLTDSEVQADHVAMGSSCDNASLLNNKQFAFVGMATGTVKASLLTAATAIASKRVVLVGPAVYDSTGVLQSGAYAAAAMAAEYAKNSDPADDLDLSTLPNVTAIEKDAFGNPLFRSKVVSGSVTNDFEDLLQGGVSPLMTGRTGGVAITHARMTYKTDTTFDSISTRIIVDQIFVVVRDYCYEFNYLRKANSPSNRELLRSGVEALLFDYRDWVLPKTNTDGSETYNTAVVASEDQRQMIVSYEGQIVRNTQTILVAATLEIPV